MRPNDFANLIYSGRLHHDAVREDADELRTRTFRGAAPGAGDSGAANQGLRPPTARPRSRMLFTEPKR